MKRASSFYRLYLLLANRRCAAYFGQALLNDITTVLAKAEQAVYSRRVDLGGRNNSGMLLHYRQSDLTAFAITKIQPKESAQREAHFLRWHQQQQDQKNSELNITTALYGHSDGFSSDDVLGTGYNESAEQSWLCTELLQQQKQPQIAQVLDLYRRCDLSDDLLDSLSRSGNRTDLRDELQANTPIKEILLNLVSCSHTEADTVKNFLKNYFNNRSNYLNQYLPEFDIDNAVKCYLQHCSNTPIGLVHGDFKRQNILQDKEGRLKLIDLQYYLVGQRLWDLAFFCSKDFRPFDDFYSQLKNDLPTDSDKIVFLFFYIISCLLNIKKKNYLKASDLQLTPAIKRYNKCLNAV